MGWRVTWKENRAAFGGMPGSYQPWDPEGCWPEAEVSRLALPGSWGELGA